MAAQFYCCILVIDNAHISSSALHTEPLHTVCVQPAQQLQQIPIGSSNPLLALPPPQCLSPTYVQTQHNKPRPFPAHYQLVKDELSNTAHTSAVPGYQST